MLFRPPHHDEQRRRGPFVEWSLFPRIPEHEWAATGQGWPFFHMRRDCPALIAPGVGGGSFWWECRCKVEWEVLYDLQEKTGQGSVGSYGIAPRSVLDSRAPPLR
jgi:hypothetical protein